MKYLVCLMIGLMCVGAQGAGIGLAWDLPTHNTDGSELTDLAGGKIYYGTSSSNYTVVVDVGLVETCVISNLSAGVTYYFTGTAYNTAGLESDYCNEVAKMAQTKPLPPTNLRATALDLIAKLETERDELESSRVPWWKLGLTMSKQDRLQVLDGQIEILKLLLGV